MTAGLIDALRAGARNAPDSGIIDVITYGRERSGLIPLWAGEGDLPTPAFICEAVNRSLAAGETFYTYQRGIPELRSALAVYQKRIFGRGYNSDQFIVTGSGMQAIQIAVAAIAGAGDEIVIPTPAWPNIAGAGLIIGAKPVEVPFDFTAAGWSLNLDRVFAAVTDNTRAIFINSPANPTGWTADIETLRAILDFARQRDIWIISDEVYTRFYFKGERAPSFRDISADNDKIIHVDTFSKNWAMTGWRIGWLQVPPELGQAFENLVQYSTSGVAAFMQRAAVVALMDGEPFLAEQIERARQGRDIVAAALQRAGGCRFALPDGTFYLFFSIDGEPDARALAFKLVDEANIGLSPGTAFGEAGEGWMRACFARDGTSLSEAMARLGRWIKNRG